MSDVSFLPLNMGDTQDDDPQVLDSLVQQEAEPPKPVVEPIDSTPLIRGKIPTRLLTVGQSIDPTWTSPTLILPADVNRKSLTIRVTAEGGVTDGAAIFSGVLGSSSGLAILYHDHSITLDGHTGDIRAYAVGDAVVHVDVWSVTE